jgi:thioredoxin-like negative regulator of GroEL
MSPAAIDFASLCDELGLLIDAPPARDEAARARLERTLTDGYAHAMSLEAKRLKLERRIGDVASQVTVANRGARTEELQELSARLASTSDDLKHLRRLLATLRRRVFAAA